MIVLYYNGWSKGILIFRGKEPVGKEPRIIRKKREVKQHILEVCETLFLFEKSFENVTMREIASRADVSVGSLYLYFRTKEDILLTIMSSFLDRHVHKLKLLLAEKKSGIDKLNVVLDFFEEMSTDPYVAVFTRIQFMYSSLPKLLTSDAAKNIIKLLSDLVDQIEGLLLEGQSDGTLCVTDSPKEAATVMIRLLISLFMSAGVLNVEFMPIPSDVLDMSPAGSYKILRKYFLRSFLP